MVSPILLHPPPPPFSAPRTCWAIFWTRSTSRHMRRVRPWRTATWSRGAYSSDGIAFALREGRGGGRGGIKGRGMEPAQSDRDGVAGPPHECPARGVGLDASLSSQCSVLCIGTTQKNNLHIPCEQGEGTMPPRGVGKVRGA